jgi:hypothetical protein
VDFLYFQSSKICFSPTGVVSSLFPPRCHLSSGRRHHAVMLCHASFPLSQDELADSALSSGNALSRRPPPSRDETEALNPHHHLRPLSLDRPILTLHYYKKIISILITLHTTQSCLYFISSLARAPRHRSSTCHCCSLSPLLHVHHLSAQRHPRCRTSRPSFTS